MNFPLLMGILTWLLPPLIGAIIGYVTNDIAIKMLFRPLKEIRILRIRLPFTPGIIPKQRSQLAESIGNMVHYNLITPDAILGHLQSEKIRNNIKHYIVALTDTIISKPVSALEKEKLELFYASLEKFLNQTMDKLFTSENFQNLVKKGIKGIFNALGDTQVVALFEKNNFKEILISYVYPFLTGEKMQALLSRGLNTWMSSRLQENTPLSRIIPENFISLLTNIFKSFLPDLLTTLFQWLRTTEIKYLLETQGREVLKNILDKLNIMQKFFLSVAQYDKTLDKKMPEIVDDALNAFEIAATDPINQATFVESVKDGIIKWEEHGIRGLFNQETETIGEKIDLLLDKIFHVISNDNVQLYISNGIDDFVKKNRDRTLKEILEGEFKADTGKLEELAYSHIIDYLTGEKAVQDISTAVIKLLVNLINGMEHISLGKLFNIDVPLKAQIDQFLFDKIFEISLSKLPEVLNQLNMRELVVNKINSLNITDVEKLLLMVIEKHLKWINIFGAFLGGLIGILQVFINLFFKG